MYIHIGGDVSLLKNNIIAIFDMDNSTVSKLSRQFLKFAEDKKTVINVSNELPRTFIIAYTGKSETAVYLSPVTASTLLKRAEEETGF